MLMHPNVSFLHHYAAIPLARRGFAVFAADSRYAGNDAALLMPQVSLDLGAAIAAMKERFERVVLLGNSGGGALSAWHLAEHPGAAAALILLNAHRGRAQVLTDWLDPLLPGLSIFDERNGPPFSPDFVVRYRAAQKQRNRRISDWARSRSAVKDEAFVVVRTAADPRMLDLSLDPSDRQVGTYQGPDVRAYNESPTGLARFTTCRSWLSQWALDDSVAAAEPSLAKCTVPALVVQGTADQGIYPGDAQALFDAIAAEDKQLHWVKGGSHYFVGQPYLQEQVFDLVQGWLDGHT